MSDMIATRTLRVDIDSLFTRKKLVAIGLPVIIVAYLVYVFFAFDIAGLSERARMDNARTLLTDAYSYKTHVTRDNRSGEISVAIEGERKGAYPDGVTPDWVETDADTTLIDLGEGHIVTFLPDNHLAVTVPDFGTITAYMDGRTVVTNLAELSDSVPEWINVSKTRMAITTDEGRVSYTRNKTEAFNYFTGWELFFFTLDSPYYGHGLGDILFGQRIDPERANIAGAVEDFWHNKMWSHSQVAWALFETILMAFLGTFGAAIVSLPLAFLAAKNFAPLQSVRFALRRVFDLFRGIDGLIWTIILARAFGPGPLTGALAILLTDTGSFGKMFSEALENVDGKQIEGVASTAPPHRINTASASSRRSRPSCSVRCSTSLNPTPVRPRSLARLRVAASGFC